MKKLKIGDLIAFLISIGFIVLLSFSVYGSPDNEPIVYIFTETEEWIYPLNEDQEVGIKGKIGETRIRVSGGTVKVIDSPCPDKICVHAWPLENDGDWTACLPNQVFLQVRGSAKELIDALSY